MSTRLFVAVDLTEPARRHVAEATARLRRALQEADMERAFRWVAVENLHITLRFIGNVEDAGVPAIVQAVENLPDDRDAMRGAFTLDPPATFPPAGCPRVLQLPVSSGAPQLSALRDAADRTLSPFCTWQPETRPFAPHLTLARGRDRARLDVTRFRGILAATPWPPVTLDVTEVTLFKSVTRPSGPEYSVLARAALRSKG